AENECAQSSATLLIRHGILADYDKEFGKSGYKLPEIQGLLAKTGQELRQAEIAFNKANNIDEATTASDGDKLSAWEDYITVFGATGLKMEESRQKVDVFRAKLATAKAAHQYMKSTIDSTTQPVSSKIDALKHYLDNYSSAGYRVTESKNLLAERIAEQEKTLNNAKAAFNHAKALENSTTATDEDKLSAWVDYLSEHRDSDYKLDAAHKSQELHASRIAAAKLAYDHILGADETRTSPSLKILDAWRNYFKFHKDTGYMVAWVKQRIEDLQHDVDNFKTALNECEEADRSTTATLQQKLEQWKNLQSKFPNDVIITQAPSRINSLRKQLDAYQNASSIDDSSTASNDMKIKTWEKYLQNYPQSGLNIAEVETRLAKLPFVEPGGGISLEMVFAPGGTLRSGTDTHTITGFWVGKLEVTQRQYEKIMSVNPSYFKNPDNPVEKTDWTDATKFCEKLSHISGRRYTLPSEAQWEYACRAGSKGRFCFGDNPSALGDYCWFKDNAQGATHPAGAKKPNSWGIHDMHGNVWEWCDTITPTGLRVLRGGCWFDNANDCVATIREVHPLSTVNHGVGFRVVMNIENIE
ncbi:MAG: SUMF1/EgtB/PvdO family nonheme iron enzyme, partial [Deltaproteobacteria bacterium]